MSAVANNWNKPGLAALAGSAGDALKGGSAAENKTTDQQNKALNSAINATQVGDKRTLMQAQTQKNLAQATAAMTGDKSKQSVVNSEQQLYIRAGEMTNKDPLLAGLRTKMQQVVKDGDPTAIKAAQDELTKAYDDRLRQHAQALGLDPSKIDKVKKQPGMSQDNPIGKEKMNSQEAYDALPPGAYFTNPKDGNILQKPLPAPQAGTPPAGGAAPAPAAGGAPPAQPAAAPGAPAPIPTMPTTPPVPPAGKKVAAKDDDDDDEEA